MEHVQTTRRALLTAALAWLVALPRIVRGQAPPAAKQLPHVDENDRAAVALGYHADATKVDATKFPTHKAGQLCSNCEQQVGGKDGDPWRPCKLFPDKLVAEGGWCKVWLKRKPAAT